MYRNQHVRRMHAVVFDPPLLSHPFGAVYPRDEVHATAIRQLLSEADERSDRVNAHFEALGYLPLGKYFEQLLFYVLQHDERFDVLLTNHTVQNGPTTRGELDLIFLDKETGELEHWELAIKYYLQFGTVADAGTMIGPDPKDTLAAKLEKLVSHQLPLSQCEEMRAMFGSQTIIDRAFIKGQFFYPLLQQTFPPPMAQPLHQRGWWCHLQETPFLFEKGHLWLVPNRADRIGHYRSLYTEGAYTTTQLTDMLRSHFVHQRSSVFCISIEQKDGFWHETSRGFVVHDDWPQP